MERRLFGDKKEVKTDITSNGNGEKLPDILQGTRMPGFPVYKYENPKKNYTLIKATLLVATISAVLGAAYYTGVKSSDTLIQNQQKAIEMLQKTSQEWMNRNKRLNSEIDKAGKKISELEHDDHSHRREIDILRRRLRKK